MTPFTAKRKRTLHRLAIRYRYDTMSDEELAFIAQTGNCTDKREAARHFKELNEEKKLKKAVRKKDIKSYFRRP